MTLLLTRVHVDDYATWKSMFDDDPHGIRTEARSHRICRDVESPNDLFVQVEFPSPDQATAARERLLASGVFERVELQSGPSVVEVADTVGG